MIELPKGCVPNGATAALVDYGGVQRGPFGAALRVDRLGSHYRAEVSFPPKRGADARILVSRLIRAKRKGLRTFWPLQGVDQGLPGAALVDGANQSGLTLNVRALTPGYAALEGFWLSIERVADGRHWLYNVAAQAIAGADGRAALTIEPMLRWPHADGDRVHLARPMIEGLVEGDEQSWTLALANLTSIECAIEEAG